MSGSEPFVEYGTIIVVSGGCYGTYYVRQLQRAIRAGALSAERILVVDHDPHCAVAQSLDQSVVRTELAVRDCREFFDEYLTAAAERPNEFARDAIVPSPLMPHLMGDWLLKRARERFGEAVETKPFERLPAVPWERAGEGGTHYVSFATWICPINCVEPRTCPHTRETRTWSLPDTVAAYDPNAAILFCRHRAYGVGMFDTAEVLAADARIRAAGERGDADIVIGTVSHCHGALTRLLIGGSPVR